MKIFAVYVYFNGVCYGPEFYVKASSREYVEEKLSIGKVFYQIVAEEVEIEERKDWEKLRLEIEKTIDTRPEVYYDGN